MHRLNLLRPQERKFFFSREELIVWRSALGHIQRKNGCCDVLSRFVIVVVVVTVVRLAGASETYVRTVAFDHMEASPHEGGG